MDWTKGWEDGGVSTGTQTLNELNNNLLLLGRDNSTVSHNVPSDLPLRPYM